MTKLLNNILITFREKLPSINTTGMHPSQKYHSFLENYREIILQILAVIKNSAFKEEKEWRLISPYFPKHSVPEIKFREGASMLVPYIQIDLNVLLNLLQGLAK